MTVTTEWGIEFPGNGFILNCDRDRVRAAALSEKVPGSRVVWRVVEVTDWRSAS